MKSPHQQSILVIMALLGHVQPAPSLLRNDKPVDIVSGLQSTNTIFPEYEAGSSNTVGTGPTPYECIRSSNLFGWPQNVVTSTVTAMSNVNGGARTFYRANSMDKPVSGTAEGFW